MKLFVEKFLPPEEIELFLHIRRVMDLLPDFDLGVDEQGKEILVSCHHLSQAFAKVFGLRFSYGLFNIIFEHGWILTPKKNIIDVYPVATYGGPILIDGRLWVIDEVYCRTPETEAMYQRSGLFALPSFQRSLATVTNEVARIVDHLAKTSPS